MVVLSPGLRNTVMFVVESQEMSGNLAGGQFFQTHRAPTFKPLSEGHTIGDKIQPLQSEILNNARISASSNGWEIGHQPSIA